MPRQNGLVTVAQDSSEVLEDFSHSSSAAKRSSDDELLLHVVDNVSADETWSQLEEHADPPVRIIASAENLDVDFDSHLVAGLMDRVDPDHVAVPLNESTDPRGTVWFPGGSMDRCRSSAPRRCRS